MMEIINKYKEKFKKLDVAQKLYYVRMIRMGIIVTQMLQTLLHIRIIPVMLSGFVVAVLSVIDIKLVEEAYKQKRYTRQNRYTMQFVNVIIILMIWIA
mgnify:CR=1 FL=1